MPDGRKQKVIMQLFSLLCCYLFGLILSIDEIPTIHVPIHVNIVFIGADQSNHDLVTLPEILSTILPSLDKSFSTSLPLDAAIIRFHFKYSTRFAPPQLLDEYALLVGIATRDNRNMHVSDITAFMNGLDSSDVMPNSLTNISVVIVLPGSTESHKITVSSSNPQCIQSCIGKFALLDLSSAKCSSNSKYEDVFAPNNRVASLSWFVTTALDELLVGDLKSKIVHSTDQIMIPIINLHCGDIFANPESEHNIQLPNIPAVQSWLTSMSLDKNTITLVTTTYFVNEHPQLAVALAAARRVIPNTVAITPEFSTTEYVDYIDSAVFAHELTVIGDYLCDSLLTRSGHMDDIEYLMQLDMATARVHQSEAAHALDDWQSKHYTLHAHSATAGAGTGAESGSISSSPKLRTKLHEHRQNQLRSHRSQQAAGPGADTGSPALQHSVVILPVFVLSGFNHSVNQYPLLDNKHIYTIQENSILIMHSPSGGRESGVDDGARSRLQDLDGRVAEALTMALTGFSLSQKVSSSSARKSIWGAGNHVLGDQALPLLDIFNSPTTSTSATAASDPTEAPAGATGADQGESHSRVDIVAMASRRTVLMARLCAALLRQQLIEQHLVPVMRSAVQLVRSELQSSPLDDIQFGRLGNDLLLLEMATLSPAITQKVLTMNILLREIDEHMEELRGLVMSDSADLLVLRLSALEFALPNHEMTAARLKTELWKDMDQCTVITGSSKPGSHNNATSTSVKFSMSSKVILLICVVVVIVGVAVLLQTVLKRIEDRAKKIK